MIDPKTVPSFTLNDGDQIPCLGMGTFGSDRVSAEDVAGAVAGGLRVGYRLFDCAACYGNEAEIGREFRKAFDEGVVERKDLFIMSKVWNDMHRRVAESTRKTIEDLQCDYLIEELVDAGLVRHIGISNLTIPKLDAVLGKLRIKPAACESEMHPCFQNEELKQYLDKAGILNIGYMPLGSPRRPERDIEEGDAVDMQMPELRAIAQAHGVHPAIICLKWALQRGVLPIPFSVHNYEANLQATLTEKLTDEEMASIATLERNSRLVKGHVFLWPGAKDWHDLWDEDGVIVDCTDC